MIQTVNATELDALWLSWY